MRGTLNGEADVDLEKVVVNSNMMTVNYALLYGWSTKRSCPVVEKYCPDRPGPALTGPAANGHGAPRGPCRP